MSTLTAKQTRLDFRATPEIKSLIEQAAAISGMTVSDYAKSTLVEKSLEVVERNEARILSDRDRDIFLALLEKPAAPNAALLAAADDFKQAVREGSLLP
jgi:uncharacterized protein (DUF1778 family)